VAARQDWGTIRGGRGGDEDFGFFVGKPGGRGRGPMHRTIFSSKGQTGAKDTRERRISSRDYESLSGDKYVKTRNTIRVRSNARCREVKKESAKGIF